VPKPAQRLELTSVALNSSSAKDFEAHMVDPESYRGNLLNLLGNQNPLDALSKTADLLSGIIREHPASVLRARPLAGKWTPNEIIGHLVDGEWVYGYRLRLIVCEDCPTVLGTQQARGLRDNAITSASRQSWLKSFGRCASSISPSGDEQPPRSSSGLACTTNGDRNP
jgi:hypothetical protein